MSDFPLTITLPGQADTSPDIAEIRARGNLPLLIGQRFIAEVHRLDLLESWDTATALSPDEARKMSKIAGTRLAHLIDENIDSEDLTEMVTDAAVLFLLTVRRKGMVTPDDIRPCTVFWDDETAQEYLLLEA